MDSIRVSEAPDTGSIPVEATLRKGCAEMPPFSFSIFAANEFPANKEIGL